MLYTHIPVDFANPAEADFAAFCATIDRIGDEAAHIHCIANMRVSAFFYRYNRDIFGLDEATARMEMESIWRPEGVWAAFISGRE